MSGIQEYLKDVASQYKGGNATEHTYRGFLAVLIGGICNDVKVTNEPKRQDCGAPDYIIARKEIPVGFVEAKDIGADLNQVEKSEQLKRYLEQLDNLILTDYLEFRLFRNGQKVSIVHLGILEDGKIRPDKNQWSVFESFIKDFCSYQTQTITSAEKLAKLMAAKAQLLQEAIYKSLTLDKGGNPSDDKSRPAVYEPHAEYGNSNSLHDQLNAFKRILIHDMDESIFADIYSQTVVYGMFAARLADPTLETFTRAEAMFLIPKSNPFLRQLFTYVAGPELDDRITWIVDSLADVFRACDIRKILQDFKRTSGHDPMIHFYETFLGEYNPKLRKARGVYYTPEPVVKFIVRSVDEILKTEFGLPQGLADTSKVEIEVENPHGKRKLRQLVHKVQLLDPAAGIGTFLCEVIRQIYAKFANQQGLWNSYVEEHLIPRVHGFELLMAPYAMCHLKLEMLLAETGYKSEKDQPACASTHADRRLSVYLTNSLEEPHPDTQTLFASWLSHEAEEANRVKRDCPVMVVIGNPPYAVSSSNKGEWIQKLLADYKKDLNERNIQPLSDDYIKFIRYAEHFIEKNGQGIVAMITNNSFIDGLIHRQMRKHLLETFDKVYILDLHGNSKKKETAIDGGKDENVFDIMQGVSISIFLKHAKRTSQKQSGVKPPQSKDGYAVKIHYAEIFGKRESKYDYLNKFTLSSVPWKPVEAQEPHYFFSTKNFSGQTIYENGIPLDNIFGLSTLGIEFGSKEYFLSDFKKDIIGFFTKTVLNPEVSNAEIANDFNIKSTSGWRFDQLRKAEIEKGFISENVKECLCTPFENKYTYHSYLLRRSQYEALKHLHHEGNIALITLRQTRGIDSGCYFLTKSIFSKDSISMLDRATGFPLYLYPDKDELNLGEGKAAARTPNLNMEIVAKFAEKLGLEFSPVGVHSFSVPPSESPRYSDSQETNLKPHAKAVNSNEFNPKTHAEAVNSNKFTPEALLDYIYAVLHSPNYREKYKEFLKIDFPRIPLPENAEEFWRFVEKGCELRKLHLMESPELDTPLTSYPITGTNVVEKVVFKECSPGVPPVLAVAQASCLCSSGSKSMLGFSPTNEDGGLKHRPTLGKVFINSTQYFDNVPEAAWKFYIGGYQPAQKWLKDRKGRTLSYDDIIHYQRIIVALKRTGEIMEDIDSVRKF